MQIICTGYHLPVVIWYNGLNTGLHLLELPFLFSLLLLAYSPLVVNQTEYILYNAAIPFLDKKAVTDIALVTRRATLFYVHRPN